MFLVYGHLWLTPCMRAVQLTSEQWGRGEESSNAGGILRFAQTSQQQKGSPSPENSRRNQSLLFESELRGHGSRDRLQRRWSSRPWWSIFSLKLLRGIAVAEYLSLGYFHWSKHLTGGSRRRRISFCFCLDPARTGRPQKRSLPRTGLEKALPSQHVSYRCSYDTTHVRKQGFMGNHEILRRLRQLCLGPFWRWRQCLSRPPLLVIAN